MGATVASPTSTILTSAWPKVRTDPDMRVGVTVPHAASSSRSQLHASLLCGSVRLTSARLSANVRWSKLTAAGIVTQLVTRKRCSVGLVAR